MEITATVGTVGDVARGASAASVGGRAGVVIDFIADPPGNTLGPVSGAILGGLVDGIGSCATGAQLGERLDHYVLANNSWLVYGHHFNLPAWSGTLSSPALATPG